MRFKVGDKAVFYRYLDDGWEKKYGVDVGDVITIKSVGNADYSFVSKTDKIVFTKDFCLKPYEEDSSNEDQDVVNNPKHYTSGSIECIDAMQASLSPEQFKGFLRGNVQKYCWRCDKKNGLEDLKKARWYLDKLIETIEKEQGSCTE